MEDQLLKGKVVVLIGASSGLGRIFAESFVREGAAVVMTARNEKRLFDAADEIRTMFPGAEVLPIAADYRCREDAARVFAETLRVFGRADALVTNATHPSHNLSIEAADDDYIDAVIDTDVKGLLWYNREAMRLFVAQDSGCILNIGSNNIGRPICDAVYTAAKYACWGLTKQIAMRCVGTGVRCNLLNPGSFKSAGSKVAMGSDTHMYDGGELVQASGRIPVVDGSMNAILKARTNRAVPVDLQQVANTAVFLISDLARDINGQMLTVDRGGYL